MGPGQIVDPAILQLRSPEPYLRLEQVLEVRLPLAEPLLQQPFDTLGGVQRDGEAGHSEGSGCIEEVVAPSMIGDVLNKLKPAPQQRRFRWCSMKLPRRKCGATSLSRRAYG